MGGKAVAQRVGDTRFLIPAASAASWVARLICRVETGSVALRPGNSQPCGSMMLRRLPSFHQCSATIKMDGSDNQDG